MINIFPLHKMRIRHCITSLIVVFLIDYGILPLLKPLGFMCGDPKISYKFTGDTITPKLLLSISFIAPLIILSVTEWWCNVSGPRWDWLKQALIWYRDYLAGLLLVATITVVCKGLVGEPRPHFLDTCQPKEALNCTKGFISKFQCLNSQVSQYALSDASKSFPSGHAAFSFFMFVFLAWFLQKRLKRAPSLVLLWLQTVLLLWSSFCSLSRITDHRHHWWDVLAGLTLGCFISVCTIKSMCLGFKTCGERITNQSIFDIKTNGPLFVSSEESNANVRWFLAKAAGYDENTSAI